MEKIKFYILELFFLALAGVFIYLFMHSIEAFKVIIYFVLSLIMIGMYGIVSTLKRKNEILNDE